MPRYNQGREAALEQDIEIEPMRQLITGHAEAF